MTNTEQLTLLMLAEIHEHLKIKDSEVSPEPAFIKRAIVTGNVWAISKDRYPPEVSEVYDVLDMWRALEQGYRKLEKNDQERVKTAAGGAPEMSGFDGHEDQLSIADFIINDMGLYPELKNRADVDCHHSTQGAYRNMLTKFESVRARLGSELGSAMAADEIIDVLVGRQL